MDLIESKLGNPMHLWQAINQLAHNTTVSPQKHDVKLKVNNEVLRDPASVGSTFNSFFVKVGQQISQNLHLNTETFTINQICNNLLTEFDPTTPSEIKEIILSLDNNSAAGYDRLKCSFLKKNVDYFSEILAKFVNQSISTGKFPDTLKIAKVTPVFKNGDACNPNNYRPISVLSCFSQVFEKVFKKRIFEHLFKNNLIYAKQFGFLPNSSTTAAVYCLMNLIYSSLSKSLKTCVLFIDLRKAFDCLSYPILEKILQANGFKGKALQLIMDFLDKRKQYVGVNGGVSGEEDILFGVPQGSIIGPLLFLLYVNDVSLLKLHGSIQLFADDMALVYSAQSYQILKKQIEEDLQLLNDWFNQRNLSMNAEKTRFMHILTKNLTQANIFHSVSFNNQTILSCTEYEYLGLVIDQKLSWKNHVQKIIGKTSSYVYALKRIRHSTRKETSMLFYNAYIDSHLTYLLPFWGTASKSLIKIVEILQKKALKYIDFKPKTYPSHLLFSESRLSINQKFHYESILLILKIKNNMIRNSANLLPNLSVTGRVTRASAQIKIPNLFKKITQNTVFYNGLKEFNRLPNNIKNNNSFGQTKTLLKRFCYQNFDAVL